MKTIIIIGCHGLLGGLAYHALASVKDNASKRVYDVVGVDIHSREIIPGRLVHEHFTTIPTTLKRFEGKFYPADVSKKTELTEAFDQIKKHHGEIDVVINLSGKLECEPRKEIEAVNVRGVINIYEVCRAKHVYRLVQPGSIMIGWDEYFKQQKMPPDQKSLIKADPHKTAFDLQALPEKYRSVTIEAIPYIQSKLWGHAEAQRRSKQEGFIVVEPLIGWVKTTNRLKPDEDSFEFLSQEDFQRGVIAIVKFLTEYRPSPNAGYFESFYMVTNRQKPLFSSENKVGYESKDRVEDFIQHLRQLRAVTK